MKLKGKTVYIFGAGASAHSGAPLLGGFLDTARNIFEGTEKLNFEESFKRVFDWIDAFQSTSSRTQLDFKNLEDVFSLLAMASEVGDAKAKELYGDFTRMMFETLESQIRISPIGGNDWVDGAYKNFTERFLDANRQRKNETREGTFRLDSIISFNYDFLLDSALEHISVPFSYGFGDVPDSHYAYLKLHGSMNWAHHPGCEKGSEIQVFNAQEAIRRGALLSDFKQTSLYATLKRDKCRNDGCNYGGVLESVFVPPTWTKSPLKGQLQKIWNRAVLEVGTAEQLVVIGYSLPRTDTFFRYLMALGLQNNRRLRRVLIVNPALKKISIGDGLLDQYKRLFSDGVEVREMDPSNPGLSFSAFANSNIHERVGTI